MTALSNVSWPAKAGHPRLRSVARRKDVGDRPSPVMTPWQRRRITLLRLRAPRQRSKPASAGYKPAHDPRHRLRDSPPAPPHRRRARARPRFVRAAPWPGRLRHGAGRSGAGHRGARPAVRQPDRPGGRLRQERRRRASTDAAGVRLRGNRHRHAPPAARQPPPSAVPPGAGRGGDQPAGVQQRRPGHVPAQPRRPGPPAACRSAPMSGSTRRAPTRCATIPR